MVDSNAQCAKKKNDNFYHEIMMDSAGFVSTFSKDPDKKVGSIITSHNKLISSGYNKIPDSIKIDNKKSLSKENKLKLTVHAEVNAILNAEESLEGATLYTTFPCCSVCSLWIIQAGITTVVYPKLTKDSSWKESIETAKENFRLANVTLIEL